MLTIALWSSPGTPQSSSSCRALACQRPSINPHAHRFILIAIIMSAGQLRTSMTEGALIWSPPCPSHTASPDKQNSCSSAGFVNAGQLQTLDMGALNLVCTWSKHAHTLIQALLVPLLEIPTRELATAKSAHHFSLLLQGSYGRWTWGASTWSAPGPKSQPAWPS